MVCGLSNAFHSYFMMICLQDTVNYVDQHGKNLYEKFSLAQHVFHRIELLKCHSCSNTFSVSSLTVPSITVLCRYIAGIVLS